MEIKETSPGRELRHDQTVVGTTPVQVTELTYDFDRGVMLRAFGPGDDVENTVAIYVGGPRVTVDSGMPLLPGQTMVVPVANPDKIFLVASAAGQRLAWMGV